MRGLLIDKCFENNIKNQLENLINGVDIYTLHFQGYGVTIKDTPLLNTFIGVFHLPMSVQNIVECTGQITGVHKKDAKCVAGIFFDPMNDLDQEKNLSDLHMFNGASVCIKAKKFEGCLSYAVMHC